jgi:hypothetical protein
MRRKIAVETGETDYTAEPVSVFDPAMISASAMEALRNQARRLMKELMHENAGLKQLGERQWARYEYTNAQ